MKTTVATIKAVTYLTVSLGGDQPIGPEQAKKDLK